jgi:UDP-N-acetylmuramate--alanine ligase
VLAEGGFDPTFVIGGRLNSVGSNAGVGAGEFIVVEADESDASFLNLFPVMEVITNIGADHMETYGHDFARLKQAFIEFTQRLPFYGRVFLCIDDPSVRDIQPFISKPITTYGFSEKADVRAIDAKAIGTMMHFTVLQDGYEDMSIRLNQPGMHNVQNACAAVAIARELGIADSATQSALEKFTGVNRRFTRIGEMQFADETGSAESAQSGVFELIDDYGHHPAEIAATIAAARGAYPGRRLVLAFQPHRYTRTRDLFEDFVRALSMVDVLLLCEVHPAGEKPIVAADGRSLCRAIRVSGKLEPVFVEEVSEVPASILSVVKDADVVIVMGAGAISRVPGKLAEILKVIDE